MHTICGLNYFEYHMLYTFCYKTLGRGFEWLNHFCFIEFGYNIEFERNGHS